MFLLLVMSSADKFMSCARLMRMTPRRCFQLICVASSGAAAVQSHLLYGNRALAHLRAGDAAASLADADAALALVVRTTRCAHKYFPACRAGVNTVHSAARLGQGPVAPRRRTARDAAASGPGRRVGGSAAVGGRQPGAGGRPGAGEQAGRRAPRVRVRVRVRAG
jgi:hypothetical protein